MKKTNKYTLLHRSNERFAKKNLVRHNQKRKFDSTISHLIDIISHIISIIMCLLNKNKIDIKNIKYQKLKRWNYICVG